MSTEKTGLLHPAFSGFSSKRRIAFLMFSGDASPVLAKSQYFIWFPFQSAQVHSPSSFIFLDKASHCENSVPCPPSLSLIPSPLTSSPPLPLIKTVRSGHGWCPCNPSHLPSYESVSHFETILEWSYHFTIKGIFFVDSHHSPITAPSGSSRCTSEMFFEIHRHVEFDSSVREDCIINGSYLTCIDADFGRV